MKTITTTMKLGLLEVTLVQPVAEALASIVEFIRDVVEFERGANRKALLLSAARQYRAIAG